MSAMQLIRETRASVQTPWVTQVIAEGPDLESLQREAFDTARREGISNKSGHRWTWNGEQLGAAWELQLDEHNCFIIKAH